jgi:hypothetical protein
MVEDLISCGVVPAKSLILKPCLNLPIHLIKHYWRGFVDGDGTIGFNNPYPVIGLCGTYAVCEAFRGWCLQFVDSKAMVRKSGNIYYYGLSGSKAIPIIRELYEGATVYLDRKYEKAMEILEKFG